MSCAWVSYKSRVFWWSYWRLSLSPNFSHISLRGINFISNVITIITTYLESWALVAWSLAFQFLFNQHFFIGSFGSHWFWYFPFPMAIEGNFEPLAPHGKWVFSIFQTPHWETNQTSSRSKHVKKSLWLWWWFWKSSTSWLWKWITWVLKIDV